MKSRRFSVIGVAALSIGLVSCGDEAEDARRACNSMLEAYARAWERCNVLTYEEARAELEGQFNCDDQENLEEDRAGRCIDAIEVLACPAANIPAVCREVISGG